MGPNILYIHSHDTGRYVQPYGFQIPTPNIQMLADQGAFFRQAFCASPTCSGSRASLLTGQYCHNNGMFGLAHRGWSLNDYGQHLIHPLKAVGYRTILIGEQHISEDPGVIGYDDVVEVDSNHAAEIAPIANEKLHEVDEPFFMSVGFFETHREFQAPTSVRDSLYSLPPQNLPDTVETREDMASFKASARSLDQGIGSVLNELHRLGMDENTLIVCTTDHGLAFPRAKATLFDRGTGVMLLMRGPGGFTGGKVFDSMVSHLDLYPTLCEVAGAERPGLPPGDVADAARPRRRRLAPRRGLHRDDLPRRLRAAARDPDRALEVHPALPPLRASRARQLRRQRHQGPADPRRLGRVDRPRGAPLRPAARPEREPRPERPLQVRADAQATRARLVEWMEETGDPLLHGPIEPPPGAYVNRQDQISPAETP